MPKIIRPIDLPKLSINDQIAACQDAVSAKYDGLIAVAQLELKQLQQKLQSALASCEIIYNNEAAACSPFDVLCSFTALTRRNECVYNAQQSYGVCCTARLMGIPVGGPPCCQSGGLCSCSNDLTDPDNIGPQVKKQKEIDNLKQQKEKEKMRCILDASQYVVPPPIGNLTVPTIDNGWGIFDWYVWRRPVPFSRRKTPPGLDPSVLNDPDTDVLKTCVIECWIRYNLGATLLKEDLDAWLEDTKQFVANCKREADAEYDKNCPPGSLSPDCGPGQKHSEKREAAHRECENNGRAADDGKIKEYNQKMIRIGVALDECLDECYERFGGEVA